MYVSDVMSTETQPTTTSEEQVDSDNPIPSAPPLYPVLPAGTPPLPMEPMDEEQTPTNIPSSSPLVLRSHSDFNMQRVCICTCRLHRPFQLTFSSMRNV